MIATGIVLMIGLGAVTTIFIYNVNELFKLKKCSNCSKHKY